MAGIHTINLNGSNNQQLSTAGYSPSWQATNATTSTAQPGAPNTAGEAPSAVSWFLPVTIVIVSVIALLYLFARKLRS